LVRHGVTDWHRERKLLGQRDIPLNDTGLAQAAAAASALAELEITDVISSPMMRAVQTAEVIGNQFGIQVARDPRLSDLRVGKWEGMSYDQIATSPEYHRFLADPVSETIPGSGETLAAVKNRVVAAVEQTLEDNPAGDGVVVVSHAGPIRVLLAHYAGASPAGYHRFRVSPGAISILEFADDRDLPRILGINCSGQLSGAVPLP
jgi:broad specificity phosphatase PhoE